MGLFADAGATIRNVILMQSSLERLERNAERQGQDIAGLRDAIARVSERLSESHADLRDRISRIEGYLQGRTDQTAPPDRPRIDER